MASLHVYVCKIYYEIIGELKLNLEKLLITKNVLRDGYKKGKSRVQNFLCPPPQDRVKLCAPPF